MPVTLVVGAQWGDEGKGRIVDFLAAGADVVARFGGGANAGHTVRVGESTYKLRIVPSGVVSGTDCIIGPGTAVAPAALIAELDGLEAAGIDTARVWLSDLAHLLLPYHIELDRLEERERGAAAIGTTGSGIGPAYVDRAARSGIRAGDLRDLRQCRKKIEARAAALRRQGLEVDAGATVAELERQAPRILPHVRDTIALLQDRLGEGKRVLVEGAHGTMLDVNFGTYPYVTSSITVAGGAGAGLGFGPTEIEHVIGVAKAYTTRVGAGPFPTELHDATGERLRDVGAEFGTVTGRPRRCGWLDLVALRYAARINGLTHVALTKLDVLEGIDPVQVCEEYATGVDGSLPYSMPGAQPRYRALDGWKSGTARARSWDELPAAARRYVEFVEVAVGVPVAYVSVGPERSALIVGSSAPLTAVSVAK